MSETSGGTVITLYQEHGHNGHLEPVRFVGLTPKDALTALRDVLDTSPVDSLADGLIIADGEMIQQPHIVLKTRPAVGGRKWDVCMPDETHTYRVWGDALLAFLESVLIAGEFSPKLSWRQFESLAIHIGMDVRYLAAI